MAGERRARMASSQGGVRVVPAASTAWMTGRKVTSAPAGGGARPEGGWAWTTHWSRSRSRAGRSADTGDPLSGRGGRIAPPSRPSTLPPPLPPRLRRWCGVPVSGAVRGRWDRPRRSSPGPVSSAPGRKDAREAERLAKRLRFAGLDPDPGRQRSLEERRIGRGRAVPAQRIRERGERLRRIEPPVAEPRRPGLVIGNRTISPYNMEAVPVPGWHADSGSTVRARLALAGPLVRTRRAGRGIRRLPPRPLAPRRAGRGRGGGRGEDPLGAGRFLQSGYESRCSS